MVALLIMNRLVDQPLLLPCPCRQRPADHEGSESHSAGAPLLLVLLWPPLLPLLLLLLDGWAAHLPINHKMQAVACTRRTQEPGCCSPNLSHPSLTSSRTA